MSWRIVQWKKHFENNRTKELKKMDWVPIPNRMDDDGYIELVDHPDGAIHFAAWIALIEVASRCSERGTLMRDAVRPHSISSISRISRLPESAFEGAIPRLLKIGWLEEIVFVTVREAKTLQDHAESPQEGAEIPQDHAEIPQDDAPLRERARLRKERRESTEDTSPEAAKTAASEKSPSLELVKAPESALESAIRETAVRIHGRHPLRRRDCSVSVLQVQLRAILKRHARNKSPTEKISLLAEIETLHSARSASIDWTKSEGEYSKSLENYFAPTKDRYLGSGPAEFQPGFNLAELPGHMNPGLIGGDW